MIGWWTERIAERRARRCSPMVGLDRLEDRQDSEPETDLQLHLPRRLVRVRHAEAGATRQRPRRDQVAIGVVRQVGAR